MTQEQIIEGNKLFAEFMGAYRPYDGNYSGEFSIIDHGGISYTTNQGRDHVTDGAVIRVGYSSDELLYHKDWNWLMPVIAKANSIVKDKPLHETQPRIGRQLQEAVLENKIDLAYQCMMEFIEWYNKQFK